MKSFVIIILFLIGANIVVYGQNKIRYGYDNSGNRISKSVIIVKPMMAPTAQTEKGKHTSKDNNHNINIYTNQSESSIRVVVNNNDGSSLSGLISVYDTGGAIVAKQEISDGGNIINLNNKPKGIYILYVSVENRISSWKIIME